MRASSIDSDSRAVSLVAAGIGAGGNSRTGRCSVAADGIAARVIASFLATAGVFYVDAMPALIDALEVANGATSREAGIVGAANMYGGACGSVMLALWVRRARWYRLANRLLPVLIGIDALSLLVQPVYWLAPLRFLHGLAGGALVGVGYLVVSRIPLPNRTFGLTILLQVMLGTAAIATFPLLVRAHGIVVVYGAMCSFSALTWALIQLLPRQALESAPPAAIRSSGPARPPIVALIAVALFQAGNMALFAFEVGLGENLGHDVPFISRSLGLSGIVALLGPLLVVLMPPRLGYRLPLASALSATFCGAALLFAARPDSIWLAANMLWGVAWNCGLPLLFGLNTALDPTGGGSVWAAFMSKIGLATGPLIGAIVLGADRFSLLTGVSAALLLAALVAALPGAGEADRRRASGLSNSIRRDSDRPRSAKQSKIDPT